MKLYAIIVGLAVAVLAAAGLVPAAAPYSGVFFAALLALGLVLALRALRSPEPLASKPSAEPAPAPTPPPPAPSAPPPPGKEAEAAAITLLGVLQEKGRLLDFVMDDITPYTDAQVAAAARVVHQGCQAALREHLTVAPVSAAAEGSSVTVPDDAPKDAYRLVGRVAGEPPFTGTLVHKGWQAESVKLPRVLSPDLDRLPVIAPAQVELK
ncbi:MAG: DUF2760 domain-containing protein [Opitutales bacterium]